tara:strand:- start:27502 stop:28059 length:558 start_codon:yes stop_codon:yes gene_type:complete
MDGVLVDFEKGAVESINKELSKDSPKYPKLVKKIHQDIGHRDVVIQDILKYSDDSVQSVKNYMYELVGNDPKYWADLKWTKDGRDLWSYIEKFNPYILTAPMREGSIEGKKLWLSKHLGKRYVERATFEHDKFKYAKIGKDRNILIDDFKTNIDPWISAGGIGIWHLAAQSTKNILELYRKGIQV